MTLLSWIDRLHEIAAKHPESCRIDLGASLARRSTLRIGGAAEAFLEIGDAATLQAVLDLCCLDDVPHLMVGKGANLLFPDQGLRGVVCRLVGEFRDSQIVGTEVTAGAGVLLAQLAKQCATRGLVGLEALAGFPASVGGAVTMNAGCYGTEVSEILVDVEVLGHDLESNQFVLRSYSVEQLQPQYRSTCLKGSGSVVLSARFTLSEGDPAATLERLNDLNRRRWESLPSGKPNAGSIFRNPPGDFAGRLLDQYGVKGLRVGDAQFSEKHANVIVNLGSARAQDVVEVMLKARARVQDGCGVMLEPELILVGELARLWEP